MIDPAWQYGRRGALVQGVGRQRYGTRLCERVRVTWYGYGPVRIVLNDADEKHQQ